MSPTCSSNLDSTQQAPAEDWPVLAGRQAFHIVLVESSLGAQWQTRDVEYVLDDRSRVASTAGSFVRRLCSTFQVLHATCSFALYHTKAVLFKTLCLHVALEREPNP